MRENENIRVLVLTSTFPRWSNDTEPSFVFELCQHLQKKGYSIDVLAPHTYEAKQYENMMGINVFRYKYFFSKHQNLCYSGGIISNLKKSRINYFLIPFFLIAQCLFLFKLLRTRKYDLLYCHWLIPQAFLCLVVNRVFGKDSTPVICTAHGSDLVSLQNKYLLKIKEWTVTNLSVLTVVSRSLIPFIEKLNKNDTRVEVCSMGVDLSSVFINKNRNKSDKKELIYVGRLIDEKGVSILIKAVNLLVNEFPDINLKIIGEGNQRAELEALSHKYSLDNNIDFIGALSKDKLPDYYSNAGIAVMPSIIQEGFGLVLVEAMGCGCVPIASDSLSAKEIITDEYNGLLFKSGDSQDLADKIKILLQDNDSYKNISSKVRESVLNKFDWGVITTRYDQILRSALKSQISELK